MNSTTYCKAEIRRDEEGNQIRALGLCSGGLDSLLSLVVLREQGIDVTAITFVSPFLNDSAAQQGCRRLGITHRPIDFTVDHVEVVKNPQFGYGSNMNPCLDCHSLMVKTAFKLAEKEKYHFVFTGEVLGQRPMSQNRNSLALVAKQGGKRDFLLRPLSAQKLDETEPEKRGWVDRSRLYAISGRGRKDQMALAEEMGIIEYPTPAGGCPLTDPGFSRRLKQLLSFRPEAGPRELELLHWGRRFDLGEGQTLILGRKMSENEALKARMTSEDIVIKWTGGPGPMGLIAQFDGLNKPNDEHNNLAARIVLSYTKAGAGASPVRLTRGEDMTILNVPREDKSDFEKIMIV